MRRMILSLLTAAAALGAENPWAKVRALKSGTELRIFKTGAKLPVDEANEENLIVVVKNEQTAILGDQIDRIDYRPTQPGGRVTKETKTSMEPPDTKPSRQGQSQGSPGPSSSSSTSLTIHGRPDFEAIYRRPPAAPQK
jgi:hypothetical protein